MRIVIADDSSTARAMIKRCLMMIGFEGATVVEAENGRVALSLLREEATDLLLTDLNMPVMDGAVLLKWVKNTDKLEHIPVVVITSAGNPAKEAELIMAGANSVMNKPVNPTTLTEYLQDFVPAKEDSDDGEGEWS